MTSSHSAPEMKKVSTIRQTCPSCPSQWEGTLSDGRMLYVRYRGGYLSLSVSPEPSSDVMDAVGGEEIFGEQIGGGYDGSIGLGEVIPLTQELIDWSDAHVVR